MVILGCAAGVILLPVLLSLTGPVEGVQGDEDNERADQPGSDSKRDEDKKADGGYDSEEITDEIWV